MRFGRRIYSERHVTVRGEFVPLEADLSSKAIICRERRAFTVEDKYVPSKAGVCLRRQICLSDNNGRYGTLGPIGSIIIYGNVGLKTLYQLGKHEVRICGQWGH